MRALIGTDGSDEAVAAAVSGVELLGAVDSVTIVAVVDHSEVDMRGRESGFAGGMPTAAEASNARSAVDTDAESALEDTTRAVSEAAPGAEVSARVIEGDAGPALCALAEELGVDVVVVGSQGKGAIKRALLGSVSSHVTNNAPCPVVVVRRGTD